MRLLADTSVWIDHFRGSGCLTGFLQEDAVVMHPLIVGELACGSLVHRDRTLADLRDRPLAVPVDGEDVHYLIESRQLWGKGIGWIDATLLATALLGGYQLWTLDKRLAEVARQLGIPGPPRD